MPLERNATTRKTRHLAEVMVGWSRPAAQVKLIRRDQLRCVYVSRPLFWEDSEVPFALRAETPQVCAYLGFGMIFEGPDDHRWWIALPEQAVLCLKAVYFEVLDRQRLYWVPSSVRRAWRVMGLEGILEGVEEGVAEKVIRLVGYIEHIKWGCVNSEYRQPLDVLWTFTPVFDNGDFVMFDVAGWVPHLEDGMVETEPQDDGGRVALRIDHGARVYGNTQKLPRCRYPERLLSHDLNRHRADRYRLSKKQKRTAERALHKTIVGAGLHGTFRSLGLAEYIPYQAQLAA